MLKPLLQKSLEDGLPPNTGKLYVDPFTNEEHSQMELQPFYNRKVKMERLLEASTIVPFRCCLHKLALSVLGGERFLVRVREEAYKHVPGTMDFHMHYRKELNTRQQPDNQTTRQSDNKATREPENQTYRQLGIQTTRQPDNQTNRQTDRKTDRQRDR